MCKLTGWALNDAVHAALMEPSNSLFVPPYCMHSIWLAHFTERFDMTVLCDPGSPEGRWRAGFNFAQRGERLEHSARGDTPLVAVCRAFVQRHEDQAAAKAIAQGLEAQQEDWQAQLRAQGYAETAGGWVKDEATPTLRVFPAKPTGAALSGHTLKFDGDH